MGYLLFIFYTAFFCWLITRFKFFKTCGIDNHILIILFLIRVIAGLANGYINLYYYGISDVIEFHRQGIAEYNLLFNNPHEFFTNIFHTNYNNYSNFLESSGSFWNDLRTNIIAKIISIFDIFSAQNFFINSLFFNFLIFFGAIYFYKVFIKIFPEHRFIIISCIFLLPSLLYFTSGIHRDGFIFLSLSIVIYNIQIMMERKTFLWKSIFSIIIFLCLALLLRNFVFITLLPALIAWIIAESFPKYAFLSFLGVYTIVIVLFFGSGMLYPGLNLPKHVSLKQIEFIEIAKRGASAININPLYANFRSFLNNAPQALNHTLMRPYITEKFNFFYAFVAIEIFVYEIFLLLFFFFRNKTKLTPFIYFGFFFSISMLLIIGYTIPIIGAIVRYRSIYLPFFLIPTICLTDWHQLKYFLHIKKSNMFNIFHNK